MNSTRNLIYLNLTISVKRLFISISKTMTPIKSSKRQQLIIAFQRMPIVVLAMIIFSLKINAQSSYWYGSLHSHSEYSDGNMGNDPDYHDVKSCYEYIQQNTLNVNYWGISDHNHSGAGMAIADYRKGVLEADSVNQDNVFTSFYGMEWGVISTGGHVIVHGIDSLIGWDNGNYDIFNGQSDYGGLFDLVAQRGNTAFAYLAHMEDTDFGNLLQVPYNAIWDSAIVGLALRNGPAFSTDTTYSSLPSYNYFDRYLDLLKKGYHVAPGIDHDNHYIVFGRTHPGRTVVISDSLNRESLMAAFKRRSFYASDDWNARVEFSINGFGMGSICSGPDNPEIKLYVSDPDGESITWLRMWVGVPGSGIMASSVVSMQGPGSDSLQFTNPIIPGQTFYYFAEITEADGDKIWTAPIWYTRSGNPPAFELLDFTAQRVGNQALLKWSTANEFNLDRFDIEKSTNTLLFTTAGNVNPTGGLGQIATYSWTDPQALDTSTYYRLNIVDNAGLSQFSQIKRVDPESPGSGFSIYPNPAGNEPAILSVSHNREEPFRMDIFNAEGKLVEDFIFMSSNGVIYIQLAANELSKGLYTIRISNSDYSFYESNRFIRY